MRPLPGSAPLGSAPLGDARSRRPSGVRGVPDTAVRPPSAHRSLHPRLAALVGVATLTAAFAVARPTGLSGLEVVAALARWGVYGGTLVAGGGVLFRWWVHDAQGAAAEDRAMATWIQVAVVLAGAATLLGLAAQAALVAGSASAMADAEAVARAADGSFGLSMVARLVGLVAIAHAVTHVGARWAAWQARAGAALALASFVWVGHSSTAQPRSLAVASDLVHLGAAAGWTGGLLLLGIVLRHRRYEEDASGAAAVVARFSSFAAGSVVALFASGAAMTLLVVTSFTDLVGHEHGRTVLSKTGLVLAVLVAAAYNHRRLVPRLPRAGPEAWARLRLAIGVEIAGLVVILLVTALLVGLATPA